jgi:tetratricopeptide (TPR) repeat protein
MAFTLWNIIVLGLAAAGSWWLSDYDSRMTRESASADNIRRGVRCGISVLLIELLFLTAWSSCHGNKIGGFLFIIILVGLGVFWAGHLSDLAAGCFHRLFDPEDTREYDAKKGVRELDAVGDLIRSGRKEEAIVLCKKLLDSPDADRTTVELTLHHLGAPVEQTVKERNPLAEAGRLRQEGKFKEAEAILNSLLRKNPSSAEAALMLIRIYAQDLKLVDKARQVLQLLEKQRHVSPDYIEFARRSMSEWQRPQPKETSAEAMPETFDELLAKKHFGTAVEILEKQTQEEPGNFEVWIKLAEVHGRYCANFRMAEKIIRQIEMNSAFNAEQIKQAQSQLKAWRGIASGKTN